MNTLLLDNKIEILTKTIPKIIYYTSLDKKISENTGCYGLIKKNSSYGYDYQIFDNKECQDFIKKHFTERVLTCYNKLIPASYRSDFFRTCVLYINGGIYMDLGLLLTKNIDNLLDKYNVILTKDQFWGGVDNLILYGFTMTYPKNIFFLKILEDICLNIEKLNKGKNSLDLTGPGCVGRVFEKYYEFTPLKI